MYPTKWNCRGPLETDWLILSSCLVDLPSNATLYGVRCMIDLEYGRWGFSDYCGPVNVLGEYLPEFRTVNSHRGWT